MQFLEKQDAFEDDILANLASKMSKSTASLNAPVFLQILEKEAVWCDHRQMAILGSRIVDPDVSWGPQYQNLLRGMHFPANGT